MASLNKMADEGAKETDNNVAQKKETQKTITFLAQKMLW